MWEPQLRASTQDAAELSAGKPLALLAYLAVEGRPVAREELAALLWPEADGPRGRASVRQALWTLRQVLGQGCFASDDPIVLADGVVETDLAQLGQALEDQDLEAADRLWKGPLFHDLEFPRAKGWHRWVDDLRTREETRFGEALLRAAVTESGRGRPQVAVRWLRRAVEVQPHKPAHRVALVEALLEARQWSEATLALSEARAAATEPDQLTLLERLDERLTALRYGFSGSQEPPSLKTEFVGRTAEFSKLSRKWRRARTGVSQVGLVLGPPGIGKTRLAEELGGVAESDGGTVLSVKAVEVERSLDWGLASELVRGLHGLPGAAGISNRSASVLARLVPSLAGWKESVPPGVGGATVEAAAVTDALLDLVCAVAEESPLLLVVDDLQWVDKHSRAALSHLARTAGGEPVMVLFTCRTGEGDPEVAKALDSLVRLPGTDPVELGPLEASEVAELLVLLLEPMEPEGLHELAGRVYDITRGNPLFMVEILKLLQGEGLMEVGSGGKWRVGPACLKGPLPVPKTVESAIRRHLDDLDGTARYLAAHMAREARPLPVEELGRLSRLNPFEVSEGLRQLFERDLIRRNPDGRLQFVHDAVEEAARRYLRPDGRGVGLGQEGGEWVARSSRHRWRDPGWWRSREGMSVAGLGAVALVAAVLGLWQGGGGALGGLWAQPQPTFPYGQGALLVWTDDGPRWVVPPSSENGEWAVREAEVPNGPWVLRGPARTADGTLRWFAEAADGPEAPPFIGVPRPDGGVDPLLKIGGDVGFHSVSPDGRFVLLMRQNLEVAHYAQDLVALELDGGEVRTLFRAREMLGKADWSPDGHLVALVERGNPDSLHVITPSGSRVASFGIPEARSMSTPTWCQDSDRVAFQAVVGGLSRIGILQVSTGEYAFPFSFHSGLAGPVCLGSGRGIVARGLVGSHPRIVVFDTEKDTYTVLEGLAPLVDPSVRWVPETVPPVVQSLVVEGGNVELQVGEVERLQALARLSDGSTQSVPASWRSEEPSVASVDSAGLVVANHTGTTAVVARFAGWVEDTVRVRVTPFEGATVLFTDHFPTLGMEGWGLFGHPPAEIAEVEGEWVLSLPGDGRYHDGVVALDGFSLRNGATAELQFRLPLTQRDRQRLTFCLEPMGASPMVPRADWRGAPFLGSLCLQYPGDEGVGFDPLEAVASLAGLDHGEYLRFPGDFDPSRWTGLALQVRPDGAVAVLVNRMRMYEKRARLPIPEGSLWRIRLMGAAENTTLHVRGVRVWPGQRY
jgi:DNA-binding SARP family transcriptional activator